MAEEQQISEAAQAEQNPAPQKKARKTRTYNSPRRQEQATVTRERIIQAAIRQLGEVGYANMTLESIAKEAGVAHQTVYAVCGSKKGVLAAILEHFVAEKNFIGQRDQILQIKDGVARVHAMSEFSSLLLENNAPSHQIIRGVGMVDPDLADAEHDSELMLYEKSMMHIVSLQKDGLLRDDLDAETACDIYWALKSPGMFRRLRLVRGWTRERYAAFLGDALQKLLLKDPPSAEK